MTSRMCHPLTSILPGEQDLWENNYDSVCHFQNSATPSWVEVTAVKKGPENDHNVREDCHIFIVQLRMIVRSSMLLSLGFCTL